MVILKKLILVSVFSGLLVSCKKEQELPPEKTQFELLTDGSWQLVEAYTNEVKDGVTTTKDEYSLLSDCAKDDFITFSKTEHEVVIDQGVEKCNSWEPQQVVAQTWVLVSNTQLEFKHVIFETQYEARILELSETVLLMRIYGSRNDGTTFETTYKYNKVN